MAIQRSGRRSSATAPPPSWSRLNGTPSSARCAIAAGAADAGALATRNAREFYAGLVKPEWAPPGWLFGPVWTALYVLMGVAAWLVWLLATGVRLVRARTADRPADASTSDEEE